MRRFCLETVVCRNIVDAFCIYQCAYVSTGSFIDATKRRELGRYCSDNTQGRYAQAQLLIKKMKSLSRKESILFFSRLMPRDRLDVLRLQHQNKRSSGHRKASPMLPKFRSKLFHRSFFFRESDIIECSTLGRGPGGQATNRRKQTVIIKHICTGLVVKYSHFPSLWLNRAAARALLNARLEQKLLGDDSELGRAKAKQQLRNQRRARILQNINKKGQKLRCMRARQRRVYEFHRNEVALPKHIVQEMDEQQCNSKPLKEIFLRDFYDRLNHRLWQFVTTSFRIVNAHSHNTLAASKDNIPDFLVVPDLLHYLFPTNEGSTCAQGQKYSTQQMHLCSTSDEVRKSVRCGLSCMCELYGMRLTSANTRSGNTRTAIVRDKTLWRERRGRMYDIESSQVQPVALTLWTQIYTSLCQLQLLEEASAVYEFFQRSIQSIANTETSNMTWASQMLLSIQNTRKGLHIAHKSHEASAIQPDTTTVVVQTT